MVHHTEGRARQLRENVREETDKQIGYERRQIEARISGVEESTRSQKSKNDELIRKIEDFERSTNNKINDTRNQAYHLKEQLNRERGEDRRHNGSLAELSRQLGEAEKEKARLQIEDKMLSTKREATEKDRRMEMDNVRALVLTEEKKLQEGIGAMRKREQEIDDKIARLRNDHQHLQTKHRELMNKIQHGLHNTLSDTIGRYQHN